MTDGTIDAARRLAAVAGALLVAVLLAADAPSDEPDPRRAVRVVRPFQADVAPWTGNAGIYLGHGLVLTAAHVAGGADDEQAVLAQNRVLPARVVAIGAFATLDAALLAVDSSALPPPLRRLPMLRLCTTPAAVGEGVDILDARSLSRSTIASPEVLPRGVSWRFDTLIADVAETGNSGSGVFDQRRGCLLGVMSRKVETTRRDADGSRHHRDIAKYFVPSWAIAAAFSDALSRASVSDR